MRCTRARCLRTHGVASLTLVCCCWSAPCFLASQDEVNGFAYISDACNMGGIVIYDWNANNAWRFDDPSTHPTLSSFTINNYTFAVSTPSDGIALSPDTEHLYYSALASVVRGLQVASDTTALVCVSPCQLACADGGLLVLRTCTPSPRPPFETAA